MAVLLLLALAFWLWFSHLVAKAAQIKGRSYGAFWVMSFCISPVLAYIIVASLAPAAPKLETEAYDPRFARLGNDALVKCPKCAEFVKADAQICRFCGNDIGAFVAEVKAQRFVEAEAKAKRVLAEAEKKRVAELAEEKRQLDEQQAEQARKLAWRKKYLWNRTNAFVVIAVTALAVAVPSFLAYSKNQSDIEWSKTTGAEWLKVSKSCGNFSVDLDLKSVTGNSSESLCLQFKVLGHFTGEQTIAWDPSWKKIREVNSASRVAQVQSAIYNAISKCKVSDSQQKWVNISFLSDVVAVNNPDVASCAYQNLHFGKSLSAFSETAQAHFGRKVKINGARVSLFSYDPRFFYVAF